MWDYSIERWLLTLGDRALALASEGFTPEKYSFTSTSFALGLGFSMSNTFSTDDGEPNELYETAFIKFILFNLFRFSI